MNLQNIVINANLSHVGIIMNVYYVSIEKKGY